MSISILKTPYNGAMKYMYKEQKLGRHDLTLKPEVSKTSLIITLLRNDARRQAIIPKTSLGNGVPHEKHFCNQFEEILLSLDKLLPDRSYLYIDDTDIHVLIIHTSV
jgi:hypothetical protein